MAEYIPPNTTCTECGGDGKTEDSICFVCIGQGVLPLRKEALSVKCVLDTLEAVVTEQASQREDLTTILSAIWNKVKDL